MKVMALVTARGGSKRLPNKNMALLQGKTLIEWAIKSATDSKLGCFTSVVVSTDSEAIAAEGSRLGATIISRPSHLATDDARSIDVVRHARNSIVQFYDAICLLQPTSPLRTSNDVDNCLDLMVRTGGEAVVSVTAAPSDGVFEVGHASRLRPISSLPGLVVPNGAVFLLTVDALDRGEDWWTAVCYAYKMPQIRSIDIDTQHDLDVANAVLTQSENKTDNSGYRERSPTTTANWAS